MRNEVRWGVLGCAGIARKAMLPAILDAGNAKLYAIASRSRKSSRKWRSCSVRAQYVGYETLWGTRRSTGVHTAPEFPDCEWGGQGARDGKPVLAKSRSR